MSTHSATRTSRFLTMVLRHRPKAAGVTPDPEGFVPVDELLRGCRANQLELDRDGLERIVTDCKKQRFQFSPDGQRIRAVQGHSIDVTISYPEAAPPPTLYHGTVGKFLGAIMTEGLRPMARNHVHLSAEEDTARQVGGRRGKPVILRVKAGEMHRQGYPFYLAPNGVWLTRLVHPVFLELPSEQSPEPPPG